MQHTELKNPEKPKNKGGRPPLSAAPKPTGVSVTVEGEEVVVRLPKRDFTRKLLAELI